MTKKLIYAFAFLFISASFMSCDKYEEGSNYTIYPAKFRLVREWRLVDQTKNGDSQNTTFSTQDITFGKNGSYGKTTVTETNSTSITDNEVGEWSFNDDKTKLIITTDNDVVTYTILQLKASDLKLREVDGDDQYEFSYVAK